MSVCFFLRLNKVWIIFLFYVFNKLFIMYYLCFQCVFIKNKKIVILGKQVIDQVGNMMFMYSKYIEEVLVQDVQQEIYGNSEFKRVFRGDGINQIEVIRVELL